MYGHLQRSHVRRQIWLPGGITHTLQTFYLAKPTKTGSVLLPPASAKHTWVLEFLRVLIAPNLSEVITLRNDDAILEGPLDYYNRTVAGVEQQDPPILPFGPWGLEVGQGKTLKLTTSGMNLDKIWGTVRLEDAAP